MKAYLVSTLRGLAACRTSSTTLFCFASSQLPPFLILSASSCSRSRGRVFGLPSKGKSILHLELGMNALRPAAGLELSVELVTKEGDSLNFLCLNTN